MIEHASEVAYNVIKRFEDGPGFAAGVCSRLTAYRCPAGIWTIGWGHTAGVREGDRIDPPTADRFLAQDVGVVEVHLLVILPYAFRCNMTQGQFDGLCSLCFNLQGGPAALPRKAPHMFADIRAGNIPQAAHEFLDMDHALVPGKGMVELAGLRERRQIEADLFLGVAA